MKCKKCNRGINSKLGPWVINDKNRYYECPHCENVREAEIIRSRRGKIKSKIRRERKENGNYPIKRYNTRREDSND